MTTQKAIGSDPGSFSEYLRWMERQWRSARLLVETAMAAGDLRACAELLKKAREILDRQAEASGIHYGNAEYQRQLRDKLTALKVDGWKQ
jgi:hypothetical protein